MSTENYITGYCKIKSAQVVLNDELLFAVADDLKPVDFFKSVYKNFQMNYPKFYKMDSLCKLAFITSEILFKTNPLTQKYSPEDIAIIICNGSASLEIDTEHQQTISDKTNYYPSPAVFVYTLPNILIGEIAIRNRIIGENTFFIFATFDAPFISSYINSLLESGKAKCCLAGWVDFYEENYEAVLYCVEKKPGANYLIHNTENTNQLFK